MDTSNKYISIICCFVFSAFVLNAQNLVPNPSFEDTVHCPTTIGQLQYAQHWINPTQGTPDYYNACSSSNGNAVHVPNNSFGSQIAMAGSAYGGFYAFNKPFPNSFKEYIEIELLSSLLASHKYY